LMSALHKVALLRWRVVAHQVAGQAGATPTIQATGEGAGAGEGVWAGCRVWLDRVGSRRAPEQGTGKTETGG